MKDPEDNGPFFTYHRIPSRDEPTTGRCTCPSDNHHRSDSKDERHQVTCRACGNHWWEECGREVTGSPFEPYTATLALVEPTKYGLIEAKRRARSRPHPVGLVDRFHWWLDPYLNPLCSDALNPETVHPTDVATVYALHRREVAQLRFDNGDTEAIFNCVADDPDAYSKCSWISETRAQWARDGSADALSRATTTP